MNEASKTRDQWTDLELGILQGSGIDIGCGPDPVTPEVRRFDREHGDANVISQYVSDTFDFVFSAHCLEHMNDPWAALAEWWTLVRPGGHLFFIVPDEDLYEQNIWPSIFNPDHKSTFTSSHGGGRSTVSVNVYDLVAILPGAELIDVRLHDRGYDRTCLCQRPCPRVRAVIFRSIRWHALEVLRTLGIRARLHWFAPLFRVPIDQTVGDALAQIQVIVRKGFA
ncbi:MAG: methyltransferase family protein [Gemmatimonadetes bacterium]|nr:methyltransferase family protein [Gemmatimonadota bacterium]